MRRLVRSALVVAMLTWGLAFVVTDSALSAVCAVGFGLAALLYGRREPNR